LVYFLPVALIATTGAPDEGAVAKRVVTANTGHEAERTTWSTLTVEEVRADRLSGAATNAL
jgi:hypothetical protein